MVVKCICLFVLVYIYGYEALKIIPERTKITYINEKYYYNTSLTVRRSSKRGEYVINLLAITKCPFGNNVTFNVILYEYRSKYNQFIRSHLEFHYKLCDLILRDRLLGSVARSHGVSQCPIPAGKSELTNATFQGDMGFDWPFEKGKAEVSLKKEPQGELMFASETILKFLQTQSKTKKNN